MILIKEISNPDIKTEITLCIMNALPIWFSPPEDTENKAIIHRTYPFFAVFDDDRVVGFLALKIHNQYTADVYNIGILEEYHRRDIGHLLIERSVEYCKDNKLIIDYPTSSVNVIVRVWTQQFNNRLNNVFLNFLLLNR